MKTINNPDLQKIKQENNEYDLMRLQKGEITEEGLKKIQFFTVKYKSIIEILSQKDKNNEEKYKEYISIQVLYKGLKDIRIDTKAQTDFFLNNPDYISFLDDKSSNSNVTIEDYPDLKKNIDDYYKKIELQKDKIYEGILSAEKSMYLGDYKIITEL